MHGTATEWARAEGAGHSVWDGLEDMRGALRAFLVRHSHDDNEIDDVIQETFLRAARDRRQHRVRRLRPWAMRIALNVLADVRRRGVRARVLASSDEPFDPPAPEPVPEDERGFQLGHAWLEADTARALLVGAMTELREEDRRLLASFYGGDLTTLTAARACGIPRHLVKVRLYRARQRLLQSLEQQVSEGAPGRRDAS